VSSTTSRSRTSAASRRSSWTTCRARTRASSTASARPRICRTTRCRLSRTPSRSSRRASRPPRASC
jgi:hypothetical protein